MGFYSFFLLLSALPPWHTVWGEAQMQSGELPSNDAWKIVPVSWVGALGQLEAKSTQTFTAFTSNMLPRKQRRSKGQVSQQASVRTVSPVPRPLKVFRVGDLRLISQVFILQEDFLSQKTYKLFSFQVVTQQAPISQKYWKHAAIGLSFG